MWEDTSKITLFDGLSQEQIDVLFSHAKTISLKSGEVLFHENDPASTLYIILSGSASVVKTNKKTSTTFPVTTLMKHNTIGEMALVEADPRSATVIAKTDMILTEISLDVFNKNPSILAIVIQNISKTLTSRIRKINDITVKSMQNRLDESQKRNGLALFAIILLTLLALFALLLEATTNLFKKFSTSSIGTILLIVVLAVAMLYAIKRTRFPYAMFGLTLKGWRKSLKESIIYSVIVMLLFLVGKYILLKLHVLSSPHLFEGFRSEMPDQKAFWAIYWTTLVAYSAFSPVQEFIVRGGIQSALYHFLTGSGIKRRWSAIILSNLLFSVAHISIGYAFAYAVLLPGLFWGWLYSRHPTLIGVSVSHILLGIWVMFILGIPWAVGL